MPRGTATHAVVMVIGVLLAALAEVQIGSVLGACVCLLMLTRLQRSAMRC